MKKILLVTVAILILGLAVPAPAQGREFTGEQLNLWIAEQEYPAGEPFFVLHGWWLQPNAHVPPSGMDGLFTFELEMDGQPIREDYHLFGAIASEQPIWQYRFWSYNFPEGLTGDHTFTLHYFGPCVVFDGFEKCSPPYRNEAREVITLTAVVHFVESP